MAFWVDDFPNFPFGGICIHSLEGNPKTGDNPWLKGGKGWFLPLRIGGLGTGASILTCPMSCDFVRIGKPGPIQTKFGKDLRVWRQKTSLENKFPHGNGQNPIFNKKCIYNCLGVLPRSFSGDQCIYLRLLCYPACWFLIHVTWVFGVPTYKGTSLGNASVWCTRFSRELSWIPKVNFRDFKVALPLSLHFREMFSGFTWMLVAEFVSKSIKVEGSISKEFG